MSGNFRSWKLDMGNFHILPAIFFLLFTFHFSFSTPVFAFDRTNVPLKNWGGFSVNRSWVYDALEKIVLAGLADQVLLNTKPLSRVEVARIVAQAVRRIQWDQSGDYNHRGNLEDLLYQLVREFGSELSEMGVKTPLNRQPVPGFFHLRPIKHALLEKVMDPRNPGPHQRLSRPTKSSVFIQVSFP